jgi:translation initiation factor IF-3
MSPKGKLFGCHYPMRIHHRRRGGHYQKKEEGLQFRFNEQILAPIVRVVDDEGEARGEMPVNEAIALAKERGFDLVEVSPKAAPPVCRLLDYGQFKYQKDKEARVQKARAKKVDVKGVRLSVKMGQHDIDIRVDQSKGFLQDGHKIKVEIMLRGREKEHGELATQRIQDFIKSLEQTYQLYIEQPVTRSGGNVSAIVGRKS